MSSPLPSRFLVFMALYGACALAQAQEPSGESRGKLLHSTHCIACHTTQMHWRDDRQAYDWSSLKQQVRRWQGNAKLQWDEADIAEVARHLNETIYRFPQSADRVGLARAGAGR